MTQVHICKAATRGRQGSATATHQRSTPPFLPSGNSNNTTHTKRRILSLWSKKLCQAVHVFTGLPPQPKQTLLFDKSCSELSRHTRTQRNADFNQGAKFTPGYTTHGYKHESGPGLCSQWVYQDGETWVKLQSSKSRGIQQLEITRWGRELRAGSLLMTGLRAFWAPLTTYRGQ